MGHEATAWGYVAYINHSHRFMSHGRVVELSAWRAETFSWLYLDRGVSFNFVLKFAMARLCWAWIFVMLGHLFWLILR